MSFVHLFEFLRKLQKNNNKDWMDLHRKEYYQVRDFFIDWLDKMNDRLAAIDDMYFYTPGKKAINRINNNLLYHPNKPTYKDHFGAGLDQRSKQGDFYIELGVNGSSIGGGYWHPSSKILKSLRDAIDYDGATLVEIIEKKSFHKMFGELVLDTPLKLAPTGFSVDHKYIKLLKKRSFAASLSLTESDVLNEDFDNKVITIYKELLPFRRYLNKAITV
jgi:uncharacterized protein (TIGR02453 family)